MIFGIFLLLLFLCGAGLIYGFYKSNVPIYLLASSILIILGIIVISEGLAMGDVVTVAGNGTDITITHETLTVQDSYIAQLFGYGSLYGGFFFIGVIFIIAIMWFSNNMKSKLNET